MPHTKGCIVMAVVIFLLLFGTAYGAKLLKRTSRNFKTNFIMELILLLLFVLFAIFFTTKSSPFTHYFTVKAQKVEIKSKLQTNIKQAEKLFAEYEVYAGNRANLYKNKLKSVANAKDINPNEYTEYGFTNNGVSDNKQIDNKMFIVYADLFPTNYSDTVARSGIKEVATEWLDDAKDISNGWKPIGLVGIVKDVEKNSTNWLYTLVTLSQAREQGEQALDFEYPLSFDDLKSHFNQLGKPSWLSLGFAIFAYILMLLSWFVTKRSTRFPGIKLLFGWGNSSNNEL